MVKQIKDDGGNVVPLLSYKLNGAKTLNYTSSSANSVLLSSKIVSATPTTNCFIELDGVATSNSHFLIGGTRYDFSIGAERNSATLSVIAASTSGTIYISERD